MEQKSTFWRTAMIYGLYVGIFFTLYSVILYVTGQTQNKSLAFIAYPLYVVAIVLAQINYRNREMNGSLTYSQGVGFGIAVMFFSGMILTLYTLILFKIDPSLIDLIKADAEEKYMSSGMSEDQVEAAMSVASKMMTPGWMAIMGLLGSVISGLLISLVTSIFVKRLPGEDTFDEAMEEVNTEE